MMRILKLAFSAAVVTVGLIAVSTMSFATVEYSKKEKTGCVTCHVQKMPKKADKATHDLNAKGKCYEKSKSMANCK
ncbi:MAG: hypothetical protein HY820_27230 [Acidobacteria bacterium]|nr:hypothetical protein [Acidobacteriota bacterium]